MLPRSYKLWIYPLHYNGNIMICQDSSSEHAYLGYGLPGHYMKVANGLPILSSFTVQESDTGKVQVRGIKPLACVYVLRYLVDFDEC
jgi:hypothetical protein